MTDYTTAVYNANLATAGANSAAERANTASGALEAMTVTSENVGPDGLAEATVTEVNGHKNIHFRLKQGQNGAPYIIKGNAYQTLDELELSITSPAIGDQYNVGSAPPYTVYRWTGTRWESQGAIGITITAIADSEIDAVVAEETISQTTGKYLSLAGLIYFFTGKLKALLGKKVDAVAGKELSTNDFTDAHKTQLSNLDSAVTALRSSKVDKLTGKGLSTNDFTNAYKAQIDQNKTDIQSLNGSVTALGNSKADKADIADDLTTASASQMLSARQGTVLKALADSKASAADYSAELTADGWTGDAAPYTQTVTVAGLTAEDRPFLDLDMSGLTSADDMTAAQDAFALVLKAETGAGTLTVTASDKPDIDLTIKMKAVR